MRIFVFEHVCGGGLGPEPIPAALAAQGGAMLAAIVRDLAEAGARVLTTLDPRSESIVVGGGGPPPRGEPMALAEALRSAGAEVRPVECGSSTAALFDADATRCDQALVIAPESDGLLEHWATRLAELGVRSLGCSPAAIARCADKSALAAHLLAAKVAAIPTVLLRPGHGVRLPAVVKPRRGAGCEDTWLCREAAELERLPAGGDRVIGPWVRGQSASASLLVHGARIIPLGAGSQSIGLGGVGPARLRYDGGRVPLDAVPARRAADLAIGAVSTLAGLFGFVGVDVVIGDTPAEDRVVEINPRLTMSYLGLRARCATNLAAALLDPHAPLRWLDRRVRFDTAGHLELEDGR